MKGRELGPPRPDTRSSISVRGIDGGGSPIIRTFANPMGGLPIVLKIANAPLAAAQLGQHQIPWVSQYARGTLTSAPIIPLASPANVTYALPNPPNEVVNEREASMFGGVVTIVPGFVKRLVIVAVKGAVAGEVRATIAHKTPKGVEGPHWVVAGEIFAWAG
jgi:hypothetical protein